MIILDAGHGAETPGKCGNGIDEYFFNRITANEIYNQFLERGFKNVVKLNSGGGYGGFSNSDMPLRDRVAKANEFHEKEKSILISIHADAFTNPNASGATIFTVGHKTAATAMASAIEFEFKKSVPIFMRGIKHENFYIIKRTKMPAILIECGFMTNKEDADKLKTMEFKKQIANAVVTGIEKIFKLQF